MHRLTLVMSSLILATVLVPAFAQPVALEGKAWKGIYALAGDTLRVCDNAPNLDKGRPAAFEATRGSGYVLVTFKRAKP